MVSSFRKIYWTEHSKIKMRQYGLSVSKLLKILHKPQRKEKAIVEGLVAVMRTNKKIIKTKSLFRSKISPPSFAKWRTPARQAGEVWIMYKDFKKSGENIRKIISAWRYPGVTKPGEEIPIPEDTMRAIKENGELK